MRARRVALGALTVLGAGTLVLSTTPADVGCGLGERSPAIERTDSVLALRLNVPAYGLEVREQGTLVRTFRVAVGMRRNPTPRARYAIDYVVWNPWWRPPGAEWARREKVTPPGWSNPVGRVKLHLTGLVFLHGSPLESAIGSAASHACVRLANRDATDPAGARHPGGHRLRAGRDRGGRSRHPSGHLSSRRPNPADDDEAGDRRDPARGT